MNIKRFFQLVLISVMGASIGLGGIGIYRAFTEPPHIKALFQSAEDGDADAQHKLGYYYDVEAENYEEAFYWYKKAADQGYAKSQNGLAILYKSGRGTPRDMDKALYWYKQAAEQGLVFANLNLGSLYEYGNGVEPDYKKALSYYLTAAKAGDPKGQMKAALLYRKGEGIKQDYQKAFFWISKAAEQKWPAALYNLGLMYTDGHVKDRDFLKSGQLFKKAARNGYELAQRMLNMSRKKCLSDRPWSYSKVDYCLAAAADGDPEVEFIVGNLFNTGSYVEKDPEEAVRWYTSAAKEGNIKAQLKLSQAYNEGRGITEDPVEGYAWAMVGTSQMSDSPVVSELIKEYRQKMAAFEENLRPEDLEEAVRKGNLYREKYGH